MGFAVLGDLEMPDCQAERNNPDGLSRSAQVLIVRRGCASPPKACRRLDPKLI
jgi:hypothetical protein